ncbi:magnesium transporter CorA family protein [Asticcacaulis endophyticus]|uniref:Magnesium transport protein CorA n=1 Tax=Asticcacaulis endophyticus TaxID=1395890 RepID=A0A918UZK1_9CAUL|nr:magnesium transporter CorA family protein [Asticcacaulis endophyticus]GGZ45299.1 magnesium transporter [Asticcacaulis endophyticus]
MLKIYSRVHDSEDGHLAVIKSFGDVPAEDRRAAIDHGREVEEMIALEPQQGAGSAWCDIDDAMTWLDLHNPTRDEELFVEGALGVGIPTREDMNEIETSSRLYTEDGAVFMTAQVAYFGGQPHLQSGPVTFALLRERLVTVRYIDPQSFRIFSDKISRSPALCDSAAMTLTNLLDVLIDRTADLVEKVSAGVDDISTQIFATKANRGLDKLLRQMGRHQNDIAKLRDSLLSFQRLFSYGLLLSDDQVSGDATELEVFRARLRSLHEDAQSLTDHAGYVTGNITYLQEAAMGLINIEQNSIIKIVSVASAAFLPPTLIASIYGMNFEHMPELHVAVAYPLAIGAMVLSAVLPMIWFKYKGWL